MNHLYEPQGDREITNVLSPHDVGYVTALAQDVATTEKNIAAIESGFFSAPNSDWMESEQNKLHAMEQVHFHRTKESAETWQLVQDGKLTLITPEYFKKTKRGAHAVGVETLGLSKGGKVRHEKRRHLDRFTTRSRRLKPRSKSQSVYVESQHYGIEQNAPQVGWVRDKDRNRLDYIPKGQSRAYLLKREWAQQVKLQVTYHPSPSDAPQSPTGERFTEKLSSSAVKKIFEAGAYVATCHGGFTTFLTLTFTEEQRKHLFGGEALTDEGLAYCPIQTTIGKEVSRFLDGLKKMYQRGFEYQPSEVGELSLTDKVVVQGNQGRPLKAIWKAKDENKQIRTHTQELHGATKKPFDFHYVWVAECPANENGEPNPHVHILLNYHVPKEHFQGWAKRVERLWGHGMANLQRIQHKAAAAGYLIKAIGYAAKGSNADQGLIKGNRYNIARCSRAPEWEALASFDVSNMTGIIKECGYRLEQWKAPIKRDIARKQLKLNEAKKAADINKKQRKFDAVGKLNRLMKKLGSEVREEKERLSSRGVFASSDNQFSISFEGEACEQKANQFLEWAAGARGWSMTTEDAYLDDIRLEAKDRYRQAFQRWQVNQANWLSLLNQDLPPIPPYEIQQELLGQAMNEVEQYYQQQVIQ
ncbi:conserved hypothetical protein [Vibrio chagasii]|nr:conserved hypothetical protein [Vibrio chagasii]